MFSRWQKWNYYTNNLQELKVLMLQVGACFMRALFVFVPLTAFVVGIRIKPKLKEGRKGILRLSTLRAPCCVSDYLIMFKCCEFTLDIKI